MTLDAYLTANSLTDAKFAEMVNVSQPTISRIRRHGQTPSKDLVAAIFVATGGAVTANDLFGTPTQSAA